MRVLLASSPHADTFGYSMPPPGLLRLGGSLRRDGFDVQLTDLAHEAATGRLGPLDEQASNAARHLLGQSPDVLGLSTMGATLPAALAIARQVHQQAPALPIILGGPGVGGVERRLLERFPWIDAVVRGEGEVTLRALLQRIHDQTPPSGIPGLTWRAQDNEVLHEDDRLPPMDLDTVAPYAWDLLPSLADYKAVTGEDEGLVPIDSGRGCSYDCSFCSIGRFWNRRSRTLPAGKLVEEVLALQHMPAARNAYLCHDLFGADRKHAVAFCEGLIAQGAPVPWECRGRTDHMDAELLALMGRAGCYRILLGVESADPAVRAASAKAMKEDVDVLATVDHCAQAGITPILSFILGLPGEDDEGLARSLDLCADAALRTGVNLSLHLANPQPSCSLGEDHDPKAKALPGIPPDMAWGAGESGSERELIESHPDLFSTWHLLPLPEKHLQALAEIARELPETLQRYPRTFALLRRLRNENALEVFRALSASGRALEGFARAMRDELLDETLAWEQAALRVSRGPHRHAPSTPEHEPDPGSLHPKCRAVIVRARHDLGQLTAALRGDDPLPSPGPQIHFAVTTLGGTPPATRTVRLTPDAAELLKGLDGASSLDELDDSRPGMARAVKRFATSGLVAFLPAPSPVSLRP